jgi:hypothetical protein
MAEREKNWLSEVLEEAMRNVQSLPDWKQSDEFRNSSRRDPGRDEGEPRTQSTITQAT